MICSTCGANIEDDSSFCPECGAKIGGSNYRAPDSVQMASIYMNRKSEVLALILSFFIPGLGCMYAGQVLRGIIVLVASLAVLFIFPVALGISLTDGSDLTTVTAGIIAMYVILIALWIFGMYDAYTSAKEYNTYLLEHNGMPPM